MLDFGKFSVLTFDCYGTLIDWEGGMLPVLRRLLQGHNCEMLDSQILENFARFESHAERGAYKSYREVLREVVTGFARIAGFEATPEEVNALSESLPRWAPFPDTIEALHRLKRRFRLGIISNVDDDLFASTAAHLNISFDFFISAQQVKNYKPSKANFIAALDLIGEPPEKILHIAQSLYHDVAPANALGLSTVWVNRRGSQKGSGATPLATAQPSLEVPDLKTLADLAVPD